MTNTKNLRNTNTNTKNGIQCVCCGETKQSEFYTSQNESHDFFKKIPWCKSCIDKFYMKYFLTYDDNQKALYYLCRKIDMPFSYGLYEGAKNHSEKTGWKIYQSYFKQLNSLGGINNSGNCFDDTPDSLEEKIVNNVDDDSDINTNENIKYWGKNKEVWEYEYLDNELYRLKTDFECPDYGMEMIMRDICFINLDIERIRQGMDRGDITKLIESRSKLMNDGNLKPVQSTGADKNEKLSLGVFIKKWENERPITRTLDDEMKRYIDTYMVGHLAKMEGLNNELVKKYDDAIKEFTIDFSDIVPDEYDE